MTLIVAAEGDADCVLAKHRREDRLVPLLRFTDEHGLRYTVELSTPDVVSLYESLRVMFAADRQQVAQWWRQVLPGAICHPLWTTPNVAHSTAAGAATARWCE